MNRNRVICESVKGTGALDAIYRPPRSLLDDSRRWLRLQVAIRDGYHVAIYSSPIWADCRPSCCQLAAGFDHAHETNLNVLSDSIHLIGLSIYCQAVVC